MARRVTKAKALGVTLRGDRNQCAGCGALFNSSRAFDKHRRTRSTEGSAAGINAWDSEIPGLLLGRVGIDRCNARPTALSSPSACDANHEQDTAIGAAGFESCRVHLQRSCSPLMRGRIQGERQVNRPPGFYTALIRLHRWPPMFHPRSVWASDLQARQSATAARMRIAAEGRETFGGKSEGRLTGAAAAAKVVVR